MVFVFSGGHLGFLYFRWAPKVLSFKAGTYGFCILGWALSGFCILGWALRVFVF